MVFEHECTALILKIFPELEKSQHWREHLEFWEGDSVSACGEMMVFGHYIRDEILKSENPPISAQKVFDFIEMLLNEGDQAVRDAAATCFLENLINYTSSSNPRIYLDPFSFVHHLGPKSKAYCRAWDEFTKIKTPGLWGDVVPIR